MNAMYNTLKVYVLPQELCNNNAFDDLIFPADDTNTFIAFDKHLLTNMQILVYIFSILGRYIYRLQFQLYNDEKKAEYYNINI